MKAPAPTLLVFLFIFWPRRGTFTPGPDLLDWKPGRKDFSALPSQMVRLEAALFLSLNESREHQVVMGADGFRILVNGAGEGHHIFSDICKGDYFIDKSSFRTVKRP